MSDAATDRRLVVTNDRSHLGRLVEGRTVMAYANSCRSLYETQLLGGVTWPEVMQRFEALLREER